MRITKNQLRQIIKEELAGVLGEEEEPFEPREDMDFEDPTGYSPKKMKHFNYRLARAKRAETKAAPGYVKPPDTEIKESRRRKVRRTRKR